MRSRRRTNANQLPASAQLLSCRSHALRRFLDEGDHRLRLRDVDRVAALDLSHRRAGALGHGPLRLGRDHLVFGCDEIPTRLTPPRSSSMSRAGSAHSLANPVARVSGTEICTGRNPAARSFPRRRCTRCVPDPLVVIRYMERFPGRIAAPAAGDFVRDRNASVVSEHDSELRAPPLPRRSRHWKGAAQ